MQISLAREVTFKSGLSQGQAQEALAKARESRASKFFEFVVTASPSGGWALSGLVRGLYDEALAYPDGFQISVDD